MNSIGLYLGLRRSSSIVTTKFARFPKKKRTYNRSKPFSSPLMKKQPISATLGEFLGGETEASRAETTKAIWDHIKANNLQNPMNKKEILCDSKLKSVLGEDKINMLQIPGKLNPHFPPKGTK